MPLNRTLTLLSRKLIIFATKVCHELDVGQSFSVMTNPKIMALAPQRGAVGQQNIISLYPPSISMKKTVDLQI